MIRYLSYQFWKNRILLFAMGKNVAHSDIAYFGRNSNSFSVKIHRFIAKNVKALTHVIYLPVEVTTNPIILALRTSLNSKLPFGFLTVLDLTFVVPAIILTPLAVRENSQNISLVVIPSLMWVCILLSIIAYQIPMYAHRKDLTSFFNVFMTVDTSALVKGKFQMEHWRSIALTSSIHIFLEESRKKRKLSLARFFYYVTIAVCLNPTPVAVAIFGCMLSSKYVNIYFYLLGTGHWTGYFYAGLIAYRAYALMTFGGVGGLVVCYVAALIIAELKTLK